MVYICIGEEMTYPQEKLITVWECGHGHEHKTLKAAQVCMARHTPSHTKLNYQARNREAVLLRLEGLTYKAIGEHFGLSSHGHFMYVYNRELRRLRHPRWLKLFSDPEQVVARGVVEDKVILKKLFLRKWSEQDRKAVVE